MTYVQYAPVDKINTQRAKSQIEEKTICSKVKEVDLAGLQTQAFRYLALEPPQQLEMRQTDA